MINEYKAKKFCSEDISLIENYDKAIGDSSRVWDCHHRNEILENKSRKQLIDEGRYWHVPAKELIFLTRNEHISLHHTGKHLSKETIKKISEALSGEKSPFYGKHPFEETRKKMSDAKSGEKHPFYGKHLSKETIKKISEAKKGKHRSKETRQKISEAKSGEKHPFYGTHRSAETRQKQSAANKGMLFWNNGVVNKRAKDCPGQEWKRGCIKKGKNHENN